MKHDGRPHLRAAAADLGVELLDQQLDRLLEFERLLAGRAVSLGYVARSDARRIRDRHVLDSLRAVPFVPPGAAYDLGSGAGLPGVIVGIARPETAVTLVERRRGKVAFLELVVDVVGLSNVRVLHERVEALTEPVDSCLSRAFAPADRAWELARPLLRPGGSLLYFAGTWTDHASQPPGAHVRVVPPPPVLATAGPLVIMTRQ